MGWINLAQTAVVSQFFGENRKSDSGSTVFREFFTLLATTSFSRRTLLYGVTYASQQNTGCEM